MSQLNHGGGRLRVISVPRSSLARPDSGTEVVGGESLLLSGDGRKHLQLCL